MYSRFESHAYRIRCRKEVVINRNQFNKEVNKQLHQNDSVDTEWSGDVSFSSLDKKIKENHKASQNAFRPLDEKKAEKIKVKKSKKSKSDKAFPIFMIVWCSLLILAIGGFLYKFYNFLEDYEKVYQDSLPYHEMDEFLNVFAAGD